MSSLSLILLMNMAKVQSRSWESSIYRLFFWRRWKSSSQWK